MNAPVQIKLTNSTEVALVDAADVSLISGYGWYLDSRGYASAHHGRTKVQMHRIILCLGVFTSGGPCVDHIDGRRLNNTRANIRTCTRAENRRNAPGKRGSSSRFKGVDLHKPTGRWRAQIQHEGRKFYLGLHDTEESAAAAYDMKARELFGAFAHINIGRAA